MKRRIVSVILLVIILSAIALSVAAETGVSPRYNNTATTTTDFAISSAGKASIAGTYYAYPNYFTSAKITTYIEKRTLGLFWSKVDIGTPNNVWVYNSTKQSDGFGYEFYLSDTGTYRATVVYEISGTGGATDVIEYQQQRTY